MITQIKEFLERLNLELPPHGKTRHNFTLDPESGEIELTVFVDDIWLAFLPDDEDMLDFDKAAIAIREWVEKTKATIP